MLYLLHIYFYLVYFIVTISSYEVPQVDFIFFKGIGFKASIISDNDVKNFTISGLVRGQECFQGNGREDNGRYTYENNNIILGLGDRIEYYVLVRHKNYGYMKTELNTRVLAFSDFDASWNRTGVPEIKCIKYSETKYDNVNQTCTGKVIFEDNFNAGHIDKEKWNTEISLASKEEKEFVFYQESAISFENNSFVISLQRLERDLQTGELNLDGCTSDRCKVTARIGTDILPPFISGKITTKEKFSFKYGEVEIRAKLPKGDWIYPQLYLKPVYEAYGPQIYGSGEIRIAMARGNTNEGSEMLGNSELYGGVVLNHPEVCPRSGVVVKKKASGSWGDNFHKYSLKWSEDKIELLVDGVKYGTSITYENKYDSNCPYTEWSNKKDMSPFNEKFYLSIGLAVGGDTEFHEVQKPWGNNGTKRKMEFYRAMEQWNRTWTEESKLIIDYIKVTAV